MTFVFQARLRDYYHVKSQRACGGIDLIMTLNQKLVAIDAEIERVIQQDPS